MKTKDKILEEALKQFNEKGLNNTGVREIARSLEISPGNMSYHFPKKEDIILALLEKYSTTNSSFYEEFSNSEPTNRNFVGLFESLFNNQYEFRGVFIGNYETQKVLQDQKQYNYFELETKRKETLKSFLIAIKDNGDLDFDQEDGDFLVSFLSLFGRFWIMEAFLLGRKAHKTKVIEYYLEILKRQLLFFATEKGQNSIQSL